MLRVYLPLALCALTLAGCSSGDQPTLVPATGKVVFKSEPVTAGSITFHPAETNSYTKDAPSSVLQLDGGFTMKTFPFGEGVAPGEYKVTLAKELAGRLQLPKYATPEKSPWKVTVPAEGLQDYVLEVK